MGNEQMAACSRVRLNLNVKFVQRSTQCANVRNQGILQKRTQWICSTTHFHKFRRCCAAKASESGSEEGTATSTEQTSIPVAETVVEGEGGMSGSYERSTPTPRRFYAPREQIVDLAGASLPLLFRLGSGALTMGYSASIAKSGDREKNANEDQYSIVKFNGYEVVEKSSVSEFSRPQQAIELYDNESCPFCRKVREAVAILDLDVLYKPTPRGGLKFRSELTELAGRVQVPYMTDPNTGTSMFESDDIIKY